METEFFRPITNTFDRLVFIATKSSLMNQLNVLNINLESQSLIWNGRGNFNTSSLRYALVANILDIETQKHLFRETVDPHCALNISINFDMITVCTK